MSGWRIIPVGDLMKVSFDSVDGMVDVRSVHIHENSGIIGGGQLQSCRSCQVHCQRPCSE